MSRMASSVLHSAVITLVAVIVLGIGTKSYFFQVFYKLWLGIVLFGLLNAFIFVPVILSLIGPTPDDDEKDRARRKDLLKHMASLNANQLSALLS